MRLPNSHYHQIYQTLVIRNAVGESKGVVLELQKALHFLSKDYFFTSPISTNYITHLSFILFIFFVLRMPLMLQKLG